MEVTEEELQHELGHLRESRATIEPVEEDRALKAVSYTHLDVYKRQGMVTLKPGATTRWHVRLHVFVP